MESATNFARGDLTSRRDSQLRDPIASFGDALCLGVGFCFTAIQMSIAAADQQVLSVVDESDAPSGLFANLDLARLFEARPFQQMDMSAAVTGRQL